MEGRNKTKIIKIYIFTSNKFISYVNLIFIKFVNLIFIKFSGETFF